MRIRIKEDKWYGAKRIESGCKIDNIEVKTDFINSENEGIEILFKGDGSSGIINLKRDEAETLANSLGEVTGLIKKTKKIR